MISGFAWTAARKDLLRQLRDPIALMLWLVIPLAVGGAVTLATGGRGGAKPVAQLLIVDEDKSLGSSLLKSALSQSGGVIRAEDATLEDGRARMAKGAASALLIIPAGFGQAVLADKPTRLQLLTNPEQSILPGIVRESLEIFGDGVFYLHRIAGEPLQVIARQVSPDRPAGDDDAAAVSLAIGQAIARVQKYVFPPLIDVETAAESRPETSQPSLALLFLPGILLMSLLFMAQGMSEDVWQERSQGTLRRGACMPRGVFPILMGKLLAGIVVTAAVSLLILLIGMVYLSIPLSRLPVAWAWSTLSGAVFLVLLLLLQMYASTQRAGSILVSSVIFPLLMLGGSMFPSEIMPRWMAAASRWTPNGWALERLKDILLGRSDPQALAIGTFILLVFGTLGFLAGVRRLRRFSAEN